MIIMICSRNSFSGSVTVQQQEQAERHLSCCYSILGEYKVSTFEVSSRVSHAHTHTPTLVVCLPLCNISCSLSAEQAAAVAGGSSSSSSS